MGPHAESLCERPFPQCGFSGSLLAAALPWCTSRSVRPSAASGNDRDGPGSLGPTASLLDVSTPSLLQTQSGRGSTANSAAASATTSGQRAGRAGAAASGGTAVGVAADASALPKVATAAMKETMDQGAVDCVVDTVYVWLLGAFFGAVGNCTMQ